MSVIGRWWRINDGAGDPQADYWTQAEVQAEYQRAKGSTVVEYVPAEQLRGAVDLLREAVEHPGLVGATMPPGWIDRAQRIIGRCG